MLHLGFTLLCWARQTIKDFFKAINNLKWTAYHFIPHLNPLGWFLMPPGIKSKLPTWVNMIQLLLSPLPPLVLSSSWHTHHPGSFASLQHAELVSASDLYPISLDLEWSSLRFSPGWPFLLLNLLLKCQLCRVNTLDTGWADARQFGNSNPNHKHILPLAQ